MFCSPSIIQPFGYSASMDIEIADKTDAHYEAAREAAYRDLMALRQRATEGKARPGDDARELQLLDLIRASAAILSGRRSARHQSIKTEPIADYDARASEARDAILQTLKAESRPKWTSKEVRAALERQGVEAAPKVVTNCLDYLVRTQRLVRVARGMYRDPEAGVGLVTAEEPRAFDGGRVSEHDV
jgi:hypothetical protein